MTNLIKKFERLTGHDDKKDIKNLIAPQAFRILTAIVASFIAVKGAEGADFIEKLFTMLRIFVKRVSDDPAGPLDWQKKAQVFESAFPFPQRASRLDGRQG